MIEVHVQPTNDWAEAEDPEAAKTAARTLLQEARDQGCGRPTASFIVDGQLVRSGVTRAELGGR